MLDTFRIGMAEDSIRAAIHQLSRREDETLMSELNGIVSEVEQGFDTVVHLEISPSVQRSKKVEHHLRRAICRVVREALVNSAKHAGPCRVVVSLDIDRSGRLAIAVSDNGIGWEPNAEEVGHGLTSISRTIRRHGGTMRISSGDAGGTTLTVVLPV